MPKVGLEIHQQLDTKEKLFCSCPTILSDKVLKRIIRRLRAVAGETGEIDIAAEYETIKGKKIIYEYDDSYACLVELDEEPPHLINEEALKVALTLAEFFGMYVPPVLQVMRKIVVDGSNTSGFQRTLLVGLNGKIKVKDKEIPILTLCLEEDSARKIEEGEDYIVYRLDRLGIPLIEVATGTFDPKLTKDVAEYIGLVLRLTGKVKRGLGTIRQDLNVSIEGGEKIEIKGAQDLKLLNKIVELEILRQKKILEWQRKVKERGIEKVNYEIKEITDLFKNTKSKIIKKILDKGGIVLGIKLEKMKGLIGFEINPNRRIGTELADVAKRFGLGGIFHSDELPKYGITEEDVKRIKERLGCKEEDAFILIAGPKEKVYVIAEEIIKRLNEMIKKIPKDTRKVNGDGTTSFLRPQPGSARMYPETDLPLIYVKREIEDKGNYLKIIYKVKQAHKEFKLKLIKLKEKDLNLLRDIREKEDYDFVLDLLDPEFRKEILKSYGLSEKLIEDILWSDKLELFEKLIEKYNVKPTLVAYILFQVHGEVKKKFNIDSRNVHEQVYKDVIRLLSEGRIVKDAIPKILAYVVKENLSVEEVINKYNLWKLSDEELEKKVKELLEKYKDLEKKKKIYKILEELRERADARKIIELINKHDRS